MPELPDLEVYSSNLNKKLKGKKVQSIHLLSKKNANIPETKLKTALKGKTITKVIRNGKELEILFGKLHLSIHFMLHGKLILFKDKNEEKHTLFEICFTDKTGMALSDYQKKARVTLNPEIKDVPDALSKELNYLYLKKLMNNKRTSIKKLLMDQHYIRGIGNAYADEILWKAGISPFSISNKIPDNKTRQLSAAIKSVLQDAVKKIKKEEPDLISGEVRDFLKIHNAKNRKSPKGADINNTMLNSRITYYTNEQQEYK
jgi:formamidopyrimidine-DNA glycosylase